MEGRKMEDLVIDYLEGNLKGELKQHVEKKIHTDNQWKTEHDRMKKLLNLMDESDFLLSPAKLDEQFHEMLEREMSDKTGFSIRPKHQQWLWLAASVSILTLLSIVGYLLIQNDQQQSHLLALKDQVQNQALVMQSLNDPNSAITRLVGARTSARLNTMDSELEKALMKAFMEDQNTNVRLAALNALARFANTQSVRDQLVLALEKQTDPIVLIQLINVLVRLEEQEAIPNMKKILESDQYQQVIKDEAEIGVMKLS